MSTSGSSMVVLLTGASSGIGRGLALAMGHKGAKLGLLARREKQLNEVAAEVRTAGGEALPLPADVTDAASVKEAAAKLSAAFGPIDLMIANAGIGGTTDGRTLNTDEVRRIVEINLLGAANSAAAVIPEMVERGAGQLVVISSLAGYRGLPKSAGYSASKAGVSAMFESLRLDLIGTGVDVTIIHPGFIKTPLTAGREAKMPFLLELDDAVALMMRAIEKRQKSYAFPWQLASIVRAGMLFPIALYDFISARNSFRE